MINAQNLFGQIDKGTDNTEILFIYIAFSDGYEIPGNYVKIILKHITLTLNLTQNISFFLQFQFSFD